MSLDADPRWRRLMGRSGPCPCCGQVFDGLFDVQYGAPAAWPHGDAAEPNAAIVADAADRLTEDFCRMGEHRFVRATLRLPLTGSTQSLGFGVWASVRPDIFEAAIDRFDDGSQGALGTVFNWLGNQLPGTPPQPSRGMLRFHDGRERPDYCLDDGDNPFTAEQADGIDLDRALEIYAMTGPDLRPHLDATGPGAR